MSGFIVIVDNQQYPVPNPGDPAGWGLGLSNLFKALANNSKVLQVTTTAFTLKAEVDFGDDFGAIYKYIKSNTVSPASVGTLRLAHTDVVAWRNTANSGDLTLSVDNSDRLVFNGTLVGIGTVTSVAATPPVSGFSISGSPITSSGTLVFTLTDDLAAVEALSTTGIAVRSAASTWVTRTITGTSNRITVTNGDGVSGAPTLDISASYVGQSSITTLGTIGTGVWQGTVVGSTYGGTGVNNAGRTLTINTNSGTIVFTNAATTLTVANTGSVSGTNTGDQTITLTGDVTGSGTGSFATTLATVNSNVGAFTNANITVNAKGLITAASNGSAGTGTVSSVAMSVPSFLSVAGSPITTSGTLAVTLSGTALPVANGGTGQTTYTDGQLLIGNSTGNTLAKATLTAGTNIAVTNGSGTITVGVTGTVAAATLATNATNIAITNDTTTNATMYPTWVTTTTGNLPAKVSSTKLTFNPSTGTLTTTTVAAALTGNASTATALATPRAINGTNFDGTAAITVTAAAGTLTGTTLNSTVVTSSLTTVGTLSALAVTGTTTQTGVLNLAGVSSPLQVGGSAGTLGQVLTSGGPGATPTWAPASGTGTVTSVAMSVPSFLSVTGSPITTTGTLAVTLSGTALPVANGGTGQTTYTDGQLLIGNTTGNTLAKATLTAGTNIAITNGSGTITVGVTGTVAAATNATNTAITDDTTTNATVYPIWVTANTGNLPQNVTSTKLGFNPSTGTLAIVGAQTLDHATLPKLQLKIAGSNKGSFYDDGSVTAIDSGATPIVTMRVNGNGAFYADSSSCNFNFFGFFAAGASVTGQLTTNALATNIVTAINTNYTVLSTDTFIRFAGSANRTVTLPSAGSSTGRQLTFCNSGAFTVISASSNVVPRTSTSAGTAILAGVSGTWATLVSNGTNWFVMAGN